MRRVLLVGAVVITALLLQSTIFPHAPLLGARPELLYLITILFAMLEGPSEGAVVGFAAGMTQDFLLNQPKGITALSLTVLGYAVGMLRQYLVTQSPWLPVFLVAGGTFVGLVFYGVISFLLGQLDVGWAYLLKTALFSSIYNAVLTPVIYPLLRRLSEDSRTSRVFRW